MPVGTRERKDFEVAPPGVPPLQQGLSHLSERDVQELIAVERAKHQIQEALQTYAIPEFLGGGFLQSNARRENPFFALSDEALRRHREEILRREQAMQQRQRLQPPPPSVRPEGQVPRPNPFLDMLRGILGDRI